LVLHGHVFDDFLDAHPIITWFADLVYGLLQWIDRTHYFAKLAKKGSKVFLRCAQTIQEKATAYAQRRQCTGVCCGHTHHAVQAEGHGVAYFNSGCWTEKPGTFLTILNGKVDLGTYYSPAEIPQEIASSPSFVHLLRTYKEPENNLEKLG
jgi:UDP-2,3-diacylglucosamine pyrophosphatase LpxH